MDWLLFSIKNIRYSIAANRLQFCAFVHWGKTFKQTHTKHKLCEKCQQMCDRRTCRGHRPGKSHGHQISLQSFTVRRGHHEKSDVREVRCQLQLLWCIKNLIERNFFFDKNKIIQTTFFRLHLFVITKKAPLTNPRCWELHVALSSTQPDVSKQHISQSDCLVVRCRSHTVGTPSLNRLQADSPHTCKNQKVNQVPTCLDELLLTCFCVWGSVLGFHLTIFHHLVKENPSNFFVQTVPFMP